MNDSRTLFRTTKKRFLSMFSNCLATLALLFAANANATIIGTYSETSNFNLLTGGSLFGDARSALINDGHTFVDLSAGALSSNLSGVDMTYLSWNGSANILSGAQTATFQSYVLSGGTLVVQADHNAYDNLLALFGVSVGGAGFSGTQSIINSYAPLTAGPHGAVVNTNVASAFQLGLPAGALMLDAANAVAVLDDGLGLGAGAGKLIVYGDVNMFDGPGNYNGINKDDNLTLWRNTFELGSVSDIPEPTTLAVLGLGLAGIGFSRRKRLS